MSKEKKPKTKPMIDNDKPSLADLLDLEFSIPDVSMSWYDNPDDFEKWIKAVQKYAGKYFFKQGELIAKVDNNIDALLIYLDKYGELFAEEYDEINRDMIKWSLNESIKKHRAMIDKIQEIERKLGLSMHHEW